MRPEDLLGGPRGRRLCWELLFDVDVTTVRREGFRAVAAAAERFVARVAAAGGLDQRQLWTAIRASVGAAMYWQLPDDADSILGSAEMVAAFTTVAEVVAASEHSRWWSSELDGSTQALVCFSWTDPEPAPLTGASFALREWRDETLASNDTMRAWRGDVSDERWAITSGRWWTPPIAPGIATTTRGREPFGPIGLWLVEDFNGDEQARSWPVHTLRDVRAFEITGPSAWARLVAAYPIDVTYARGADWNRSSGRDARWLLPDWSAVAADYDALHLTIEGYLATSGRSVSIGRGAASFIAGWNPDETYWLADVLGHGDPTDWVGADRGEDWKRCHTGI